ncbi:Fur family transcriptional regulator [Geobacter sp. SVR]|uniref:Fur family transcriptional regulator n=1 Tax=Geobacter sp. SVR TaxID=2495594 RepID=UPI00143EF74C|nr:Fur family transcriptional regulator [Geobacter sp. SVR]BCS53745.1 transcriptional repressor [Geobacter sp. SVR]GCF85746.1 transcriptional repressor [Geobacter sp. SVR]
MMDRHRAGAILKELQLKTTPKRVEVMRLLAAEPSFLSADDVWQRLKSSFTHIGLPTVYRILDELTGAGVITRIFLPDRKQYYFLCTNQEHHHHFVCESCRRVEDVEQEQCGLDGLAREISRRSGARVTSHILQINGVCGTCLKEGAAV